MYSANYMLNVPQYGVLDNPYMTYAQPKQYTQADWNGMVSDAIVGNNTPGLSPINGSILGFLGNTFGQALSQFMQYTTQSRMMDKANEYNSPKNMMRRMVEAGINPAAAAQGIAGSPGAGASSTPAAGLTSNSANLADLFANSVNTALNADVLRTEAGLNSANAEFTRSQNVEQQVRNRWADLEHNATLKNLVYRNVIDKAQGEIIAADAKYADANAYAKWMTTMQTLRKISNEADVLDQKYYTEMAQTYATMMAGNLSEAQIHKVFSDIGLNNAQIQKIGKECENIAADTLLKGQQMSESEARTTAQQIQNKFQQEYFDIWQNTGWDMNSDVDMNVYRMVMNGELDKLERFQHGMNIYIGGQGDARAKGKDFIMENAIEIYKTLAATMMPMMLRGASPAAGAASSAVRPRAARGRVNASNAQDAYVGGFVGSRFW